MRFNRFNLLAFRLDKELFRLWKKNTLFLAIAGSSSLQLLYRIAALKTFAILLVKHPWWRWNSCTSTLLGRYHGLFPGNVLSSLRVASCQETLAPMPLTSLMTALSSNLEQCWRFNKLKEKLTLTKFCLGISTVMVIYVFMLQY